MKIRRNIVQDQVPSDMSTASPANLSNSEKKKSGAPHFACLIKFYLIFFSFIVDKYQCSIVRINSTTSLKKKSERNLNL